LLVNSAARMDVSMGVKLEDLAPAEHAQLLVDLDEAQNAKVTGEFRSAIRLETELTILMPCLNEAETLATCVRKSQAFLSDHKLVGEVLVADNGSIDRSRDIAASEGARVVPVERRGYGAALMGGIAAAKGKYIIMGDADDSYEFSDLTPFLARLREGADLVIGNRFKGGIEPGAMPFLHRYLGNPVLSWLGRLFFGITVRDFHCGLRASTGTRSWT
jgi:glycosyltransferase involved in cell wall biosynthesis